MATLSWKNRLAAHQPFHTTRVCVSHVADKTTKRQMGAEHVVYRKIMLAHDGSASATTGLRQATALARLCQAELYILGIVPTSGGFAIAQAAGGADVCGMKRRMIEQSLSEADTGEDCQGVNPVSYTHLTLPTILRV